MFTAEQKTDYQNLQEENKDSKKYLAWSNKLEKNLVVILLLSFPILLIASFLKIDIIFNASVIVFTIALFLAISLVDPLKDRAKSHSPSPDKLIRLHSYSIIKNLDCYFDKERADTIKLKSNFRNNAIKSSEALLSIINRNWFVGNFRLGKETLGDTVSNFKKNIKDRLVPNIKTGDADTLLKKSNNIIWQFVTQLKMPNFTVDDLVRINGQLENDLPLIKKTDEVFSAKVSNFIRSDSIVRDIFSVLVITGFAIFVAYLGAYLSIQIEYIWASFWVIWIGLFGCYFGYIRKRKES